MIYIKKEKHTADELENILRVLSDNGYKWHDGVKILDKRRIRSKNAKNCNFITIDSYDKIAYMFFIYCGFREDREIPFSKFLKEIRKSEITI